MKYQNHWWLEHLRISGPLDATFEQFLKRPSFTNNAQLYRMGTQELRLGTDKKWTENIHEHAMRLAACAGLE